MFSNLDALATLAKYGTMSAAANILRVSQSAVSKRIATLESHLKKKLIEPQGRKVVLTPAGERLLERTTPILAELKSALFEEHDASHGILIVGVSLSILSSWGARSLAYIKQAMPTTSFELHTMRGPVVLERVRAGEYMVGICAGIPGNDTDLYVEHIADEPMIIIPARLEKLSEPIGKRPLRVITAEATSQTWKLIKPKAERLKLEPELTLESFVPVAQLACHGFGHGLVPIGVAHALNIPSENLISLESYGLSRPISLVARKSTFARPLVSQFRDLLLKHVQEEGI